MTDAIRRSTLDWTVARITSPSNKPANAKSGPGSSAGTRLAPP
jgi:hypothetical protein